MKRRFTLLTLLLLSCVVISARAQDEISGPPQGDLFTGSFASTREMLLYRKAAEPYIVTIQGERFIDRAYFEIDVTHDGQPVPADTVVTIDVEPSRQTDQILVNDDTVNETGMPMTYAAQPHTDGLFVINPMLFDAAGGWLVHVTVDGDVGVGRTSFQMRVYPHQPETPIWFSLASLSVPFLVALIVLAVYRWRRIPLTQVAIRDDVTQR